MRSQNNVRDLKATAHIFPPVCTCGCTHMYICICMMGMCICVCVYTRVWWVCVYACVCLCLCIYMCVYVYYGVYVSAYVCEQCVCVYARVYMCMYVTCMCVCMHVCVYVGEGSRLRRIKISCRLFLSHSPPNSHLPTPLHLTWLGITAKIRQFLIEPLFS